jgi:hypothetical protein
MALRIFNVSFPRGARGLIDEKVCKQFGTRSDFLRAAAVRYLRAEQQFQEVMQYGTIRPSPRTPGSSQRRRWLTTSQALRHEARRGGFARLRWGRAPAFSRNVRFIGDDPEGGERLDGVAGVWRRAAARLIGPAPHSAPLARLCRQAMAWGLAPVRTWEPSSAKVVSRR